MSGISYLLFSLMLIALLRHFGRSSPLDSARRFSEYTPVSSGIDCIPQFAELPGNFLFVLREPPNVGANLLIKESLTHAFAHIFTEVLPRQSLEEQYRAPYDVQLSYALLPGRRQVYRFDVVPSRFQSEVSQILETIFERLPALPLVGGSLFAVCRFRVNRHSSCCPVFPRPYAGLIDGESQISWEAQLEHDPAFRLSPIDETRLSPEECQRLIELAPENGHAHWLLGALYRERGEPELALEALSKLLHLNTWQHMRLPRAEILLALGRPDEARIELDALLAVSPELLPALVLRTDALRMAGDLPAAEVAADRALHVAPWNWTSYLARAHVEAARKNHREAARFALYAHFCCPAAPGPLLVSAEQRAVMGELDSALGDLEKLESLAPGWPPALQLKAQVLFVHGRFAAAVETLTEVLKAGPEERALLLRGRALASLGKLESAHADFTSVLELNGENGEALLYRAHVSFDLDRFDDAGADASRAVVCGTNPSEAHFLRGMIALREENAAAAREAFDEVLARDPLHQRALFERSQLCLNQGNPESALPDCQLAVETYPETAAAWFLRGESRRQLGDVAAAIEDFDESLSRDSQFAAALFGRARALSGEGRHRPALRDLDRVVERHPDWQDPRWLRANLLLKQGDAELAIADLRYLRLHAEANAFPTRIMEVQALLFCERYAEVLPLCEEIVEASSDFWLAWIWHGHARVHLEGPDRGRESFDRALELQPDQAAFIAQQQGLAAAAYHLRREEFDDAIRITTQCLEDEPESIPARHQRAAAYWYSQRLVEAVEDFSAILQDHPQDTAARSGRGQALAELGDDEAARLDLDQAIAELEESGAGPLLAYALSGRALTWIARGDRESADADLDRSLLLAPLNAWSMYHRGLRYHAERQPQAALWCFRLAVVLEEPKLPPHKRAKAQAYVASHSPEADAQSE